MLGLFRLGSFSCFVCCERDEKNDNKILHIIRGGEGNAMMGNGFCHCCSWAPLLATSDERLYSYLSGVSADHGDSNTIGRKKHSSPFALEPIVPGKRADRILYTSIAHCLGWT